MLHRNRLFFALLISSILIATPTWTLAKGGGGGGGKGGGGGGGRSGGGGGHGSGGGGHSGSGGGGSTGVGGSSGAHWGGWPQACDHAHGGGNYGHTSSYGYGWGGNPCYGYGPRPGVGLGYGGYGYGGYGYPGYGYFGNVPYGTSSGMFDPPADVAGIGGPPDPNANVFAPTPPGSTQGESGMSASTREFIEKGEQAFKAGKYADAVYDWRHAVVDEPQNGLLTMMLGQALFATGEYQESVFATQAAMHELPTAQWGVVVCHYTQLYGNNQDYTSQLRALEWALQAKPNEPALRFLTGFQYGYLGYVDQAIDQLDEAMLLARHDEMTDLLRNEMRIKRAKSAARHHAQGIPSAHGSLPTLH